MIEGMSITNNRTRPVRVWDSVISKNWIDKPAAESFLWDTTARWYKTCSGSLEAYLRRIARTVHNTESTGQTRATLGFSSVRWLVVWFVYQYIGIVPAKLYVWIPWSRRTTCTRREIVHALHARLCGLINVWFSKYSGQRNHFTKLISFPRIFGLRSSLPRLNSTFRWGWFLWHYSNLPKLVFIANDETICCPMTPIKDWWMLPYIHMRQSQIINESKIRLFISTILHIVMPLDATV